MSHVGDWLEIKSKNLRKKGYNGDIICLWTPTSTHLTLAFMKASQFRDEVKAIVSPDYSCLVVGTKSREDGTTIRQALDRLEDCLNGVSPPRMG